MPGHLSLDDLREAAALGEIDTVAVAMVDMQGRLVGKHLDAKHFVEHGWRGAGACDYLLACDIEMVSPPGYRASNWQGGFGDLRLRPDLSTLRRTPWVEGAALVLCDALDRSADRLTPHAPRSMLRAQADRLAAKGWTATVATELEFYLFRNDLANEPTPAPRDLRPLGRHSPDYSLSQDPVEEATMRAVRVALAGADIAVEGSRGEASPGQQEVNVRPADALTAADRHAVAKAAIKRIAAARGLTASFMAKWSDAQAGSSSHVHLSLTDADGRNLFHDPAAPHGMSALMRAWLGGMLAHADAMTLFLAPYVNSYKRFAAESFAPTRAVWSVDNRTAGFRVCGVGTPAVRIECRIGGADLTPHVALAALLAAGLDGLERVLDPGPALDGDAYRADDARSVPGTLRAAVDATAASSTLRAALGDAVVDHYLHAARWEQSEADRRVTDWDVARGLERA